MTQPTHTHRDHGGKYAEIAQYQGAGALEGQWLVVYEDLDKGVQSATTQDDWRQQWRPLERDDCPLCLGAGTDPIKGDKSKPCGHCYGLGKVRADGKPLSDLWGVADIATGIIQRQRVELEQLRAIADYPGVRELVERERQQRIDASITLQEQEWRGGKGHSHGGQRYTGD
ncbi:hypothetical protein [Vreelandella malpeensis]|uniref:Uncharacterized protein n=1 Tax=Vreelandella malpeensis TaxID=1172368 RepID=A0ABS8DUF5_9GAMM|nr:hypothetical protein [Halomonas malpeensis]MCB8889968.1 hypothetical protein [Halomonas malpeensis]